MNDDDLLLNRLNASMGKILEHMREGKSLLEDGFAEASLGEYEQCLLDEPTYAHAWDEMAEVYEKLGDLNKADRCRESAHRIREKLG